MFAKDKDGGVGGAGGHGFLDRSKVKILLCDNDAKSSEEVRHLLVNCSYQVTLVRTARQVVDVLNVQGPDIDIILAEVDLPTTKGFKMLKYITRNVELRRIPIIMMSSQDEVSVVVKCLRLGAADYLVKPLRTNELLNLWTHMWRRRRMLGLTEKSVLNNDFDLLVSDHSDANTNSTTLFSDDTDDKLKIAVNPEPTISNHQTYQSVARSNQLRQNNLDLNQHITETNADRAVFSGVFSHPRKTDLKIGESSAFLTYVRSDVPKNRASSQDISAEEKHFQEYDTERCPTTQVLMNHSNGDFGYAGERTHDTNANMLSLEDRDEASKIRSIFPMPVYFPGRAEQMAASNFQMYQVDLSQYPHMPMMMPSYPYYPVGMNLPAVHLPAQHLWSSTSSSSTPETKSSQTDRREAALIKFRQKRKERCFDKKIRYVNRKKLAEKRPRIRGQFVRNADGGLDTHLHDLDEDEPEENISREIEPESSPEHPVIRN